MKNKFHNGHSFLIKGNTNFFSVAPVPKSATGVTQNRYRILVNNPPSSWALYNCYWIIIALVLQYILNNPWIWVTCLILFIHACLAYLELLLNHNWYQIQYSRLNLSRSPVWTYSSCLDLAHLELLLNYNCFNNNLCLILSWSDFMTGAKILLQGKGPV